ncbi:MAG: hypothetical protein HOE77_08120 [Candidatus Marinimicrobia bacterium]|jgi:hypothetical protein|nr:hypothetical protein [Candidatus Neomarinimicrobiota bacterium]
MAQVAFETLADELRIDIPEVVDALAIREVRNIAIDFCERTRCWKFEQDTIITTTNSEYDMEPPSGAVVSEIIRVEYGGTILVGKPYEKLINYTSGATQYYGMINPKVIRLSPTPVAGKALDMLVVLKPSTTAKRIEDYIFNEYSDAFRHGALMRLFAMANKPWTDGSLAGYHRDEYRDLIDVITTKSETGGVRTTHTVQYGGI